MYIRPFAVVVATALTACADPGPQVWLDGERADSLAAAAAAATEGASIVLGFGEHVGGVTLPDGVTIEGPARVVGGVGRLLDGEGALTLRDLELVGGSADEAASVWAGELRLEGVHVHGASGPSAVVARGSLFVRDSTIEHPGVALQTRSPTGRPPRVEVLDTQIDGRVATSADQVVVRSLGGRAALQVTSQSATVSDSALASLELIGPNLRVSGVDVEGTAYVQGLRAALLDVAGPRWELRVGELTADGIDAPLFLADAARTDLRGLRAVTALVYASERLGLSDAITDHLHLEGFSLAVRDVRGRDVTLWGRGSSERIGVTGVQPRLVVGLGEASDVVARSEQGPLRLRIEAGNVRNIAVVEPRDAVGAYWVNTDSYGTLRNASWIGGRRTASAPDARDVLIRDSLLDVVAFGDRGEGSWFTGSVASSQTEALISAYGLTIDSPGFLADDDVRLAPDSAWHDRGAFADDLDGSLLGMWLTLR